MHFAERAKALKIAVWHNLPSGGGKRALYYHVQGLVERGHSISAWAPTTADPSYLPLTELVPERRLPLDLTEWSPPSRPTWRERQFWGYESAVYRIRRLEEHARACADEISAQSFDILFANSCRYLRLGFIGRFISLPKIAFLQEPNRALYEAAPTLPWLALQPKTPGESRQSYLKAYVRNLIQVQGLRVMARAEYTNACAYDSLLVNSFYSRESVKRAYGIAARVCYLGIDTNLFHPTGVPRENYVLGIGAIHPDKAIETAIRAVGAVPKTARPPLRWIGNISNRHYLETLHLLARQHEVTFSPEVAVSDTRLVDAMNRAAVLLYTPRLEPFGFAPLEANACETPVVGVAEGGLRETIRHGENGLLVETGEPEEIADALASVLSDSTRAREMGQCARQIVLERWTWAAAIDRLEQALLSVRDRAPKQKVASTTAQPETL